MSETSSDKLAGFALAVTDQLAHSHQTAYSYETSLDGNDTAPTPADEGADSVPVAALSDLSSAYVYTDCSGWIALALDSVAPLHQAVAATARTQPRFNQQQDVPTTDGPGVPLHEGTDKGWARAFTLADLFHTAEGGNGFTAVSSFANLQAGDLIAYAKGIYADPTGTATLDSGLIYTGDTGHTMIVLGTPQLVTDPDGPSGPQNRSTDVVAVYAVPVSDSSNLEHFTSPQGDARRYAGTPADAPAWLQPQRGGTGTGTLWFGVDKDGNAVQWRFDTDDSWQPPAGSGVRTLVGAARLTDTINLSDTALDGGWLDVRLFPNAAPLLDGTSYAAAETLTGTGNVRVTGSGTLTLGAGNSYVGTTEVGRGITLQLQAASSLGAPANTVTLDDGAVLRFGAAMTLEQGVSLAKEATVDLAGHVVQATGGMVGDADTVLTLASSAAGGELQLAATGDAGQVVVGAGTTLTFTGAGQLASTVALDGGATLHVSQSGSLDRLLVSGATALQVDAGATLTLLSGPVAAGDAGFGTLTVSGTGTLLLQQAATSVDTLFAGDTLFVGSLATLAQQDLAGFKAGDVIDVSDLLPVADGSGITTGVTASYDDATGLLTVVRGTQSAVLRLAPGVTDVPAGYNHLEFTVRTDGAGGTLIGTAPGTEQQDSIALRATAVRANGGPDGTNVVVGIISDSFNTLGGAAQDQAHDYLALASTNIVAESPTQGGDEGREMARIVHNIAPGATIDFVSDGYKGDDFTRAMEAASAPASQAEQDMASAVYKLVESGARVIVDDIGLPDGRSYEPGGMLADAIAYAYAHGVTLVTSAGNQGNNFYEDSFALNQTDALPGLGTTYAYAFHPGQDGARQYLEQVTLGPTSYTTVPIKLSWDQPAQGSAYTLDIKVYSLVDGSYRLLPTAPGSGPWVTNPAAFTTNQSSREVTINDPGAGQTFYLAVTGSAAASGTFKFVVNHQGDTPVFKDMVTNPGSGTISGHALDPHEIAVGAVNYANTPAYKLGTPTSDAYSASGPGTLLFDAAGSRLPAPVTLGKPDLSGVDGTPDDTGGVANFFSGTSAAAPSIAGVAALLLAANPALTPAQVRAALVASALPMADAALAGAGLAQTDKAVALARLPTVLSAAAEADTAGTVTTGHAVTITLATSAGLTATAAANGSLPTLTLDDGGTATLDVAASSGTSLVFRTVAAPGQSSANLRVLALQLNGAVLQNAAGVALAAQDLTGVAGSVTGLVVDAPLPPAPPNPDMPALRTAAPGETLFAGNGTLTVVGAASGSSTLVGAAGGTTFVTSGGSTLIQGGSGHDTVQADAGNATVLGGTGGSLVRLGTGSGVVASHGADTVFGGAGDNLVAAFGPGVTLFGGAGRTVFVGGSTASTVAGGTGSATVFGGAGGGLLAGGTAGNNVLLGGQGATTLFGGGSGDALFALGSAGTMVVAGAGNETLQGAFSSGNDTFFAGAGSTLIGLGCGQNTVVAGAGRSTVLAGAGADTFLVASGQAGGTLTVYGFKADTDHVALAGFGAGEPVRALATSVTDPSGTAITLFDQTRIELVGVQSLTPSAFV